MSYIFSILEYFFDPLPSRPFQYVYLLTAVAALLFIASIGTKMWLKKAKEDKILKKLLRNLPGNLLILAICESIYILARLLEIPFFSMRIFNYALGVFFIFLMVKTFRTYTREYPEMTKRREEQIKVNKYLPRKNSGK